VGRFAQIEPGTVADGAEIAALRAELQQLQHLVRHGEEFWRGWARVLGLDTGYTPGGGPGAMEGTMASRLSVKG
jgi:hypothetical protein